MDKAIELVEKEKQSMNGCLVPAIIAVVVSLAVLVGVCYAWSAIILNIIQWINK